LEGNVQRDRRNVEHLELLGWHVLTVWECETRPAGMPDLQVRLLAFMES
jgi:DNA mismatch endonuclease (patch repair protein)